ncbi:MAG: transcriptional regulator NrdR [Planctomycetota bacterium]|nr:transcriptional regulator NrdR [Planctomycetota bacterium]
MICPHCGSDNDKVIDSRACEDGRAIRRRRFCNNCNHRFTTYERVEQYAMQVVKKHDNTREPFSREKIEKGLERACWKRPISSERIRAAAAQIEADIRSEYESEIPSSVIGHMVMQGLADLDQIAYVRFASVYREFKSVEEFMNELQPLRSPDVSQDDPR